MKRRAGRAAVSGKNNPAYLHGHTDGGFSPTYHSWSGMIQRCTNPKRDSYPRYGGRGIKVCDRWLEFQNFLDDMGERPDGTTLDRRDNDGPYDPNNCRWATNAEQRNNSSYVVRVEIDGVVKPLATWCEELNMSANTVRARVRRGFTYAQALLAGRRRTSL